MSSVQIALAAEVERLRAELDACETELRTVRTSQAESNAEIERLRAELAALDTECAARLGRRGSK